MVCNVLPVFETLKKGKTLLCVKDPIGNIFFVNRVFGRSLQEMTKSFVLFPSENFAIFIPQPL